MSSILAKLQTPETTEEQKPDQQLSDAASPGASVHTGSPGSDGSEVNLQSPANSSNNIQTIAQAASRPDLSRGGQSPAATGASKAQPPHLPNRYLLTPSRAWLTTPTSQQTSVHLPSAVERMQMVPVLDRPKVSSETQLMNDA